MLIYVYHALNHRPLDMDYQRTGARCRELENGITDFRSTFHAVFLCFMLSAR